MGDTNLVATCGLYCGACEMYRADHDNNVQKLENLAMGLSEKPECISQSMNAAVMAVLARGA